LTPGLPTRARIVSWCCVRAGSSGAARGWGSAARTATR
jgi:hypothetical protein